MRKGIFFSSSWPQISSYLAGKCWALNGELGASADHRPQRGKGGSLLGKTHQYRGKTGVSHGTKLCREPKDSSLSHGEPLCATLMLQRGIEAPLASPASGMERKSKGIQWELQGLGLGGL